MELRQQHHLLSEQLRQLGARQSTIDQHMYQTHDEIEDKIEGLTSEIRRRGETR